MCPQGRIAHEALRNDRAIAERGAHGSGACGERQPPACEID